MPGGIPALAWRRLEKSGNRGVGHIFQQEGAVNQGLEIGEIETAKFMGTAGTPPEPQDAVPVLPFGEPAVDPMGTAAFETVEERPFLAKQSLLAISAYRDHHFARGNLLDLVDRIAERLDQIVNSSYLYGMGIRAMIKFTKFFFEAGE
jgi:hypothetical protein